ncbi:MAG: GNAT family N-acetyltransferase, partial [Acidobacteria bacterium]|nr:GNAT family N-acetyltransferase [Acidobacteriota bacterium]
MTATLETGSATGGFDNYRWQHGLPTLFGKGFILREVQQDDAVPLFEQLTDDQVTRFMSRPPGSARGFETFIEWIQTERAMGRGFCYAIVPDGSPVAVGLVQGRELEPGFTNAEWGFALARSHWATGLFMNAAELVVDFVFLCAGAYRLEARAFVENGRGNGVLRKLGAVPEGVLRKSFKKDGEYFNQVLWSMNGEDWLGGRRSPRCAWEPSTSSGPVAIASEPIARSLPEWARGLPVITGNGLTLRELTRTDAPAMQRLAAPEVTRYVPPPPDSVEALERFIAWTQKQRETGAYVCYAAVPEGEDAPAGIYQIRQLEPTFETAEWGFLFASAYWGTGIFMRSAPLVLDFIFQTIGVHRLEARAAVANVRANKVLSK